MSNFNLHRTIVNLCLIADSIDEYLIRLTTEKEMLENKLIDLYHIVELYDLTDAQIKRLYKEMKRVLKSRRNIKNDMYIGDIFSKHKSKLPSESSRKFLLQAVGVASKRQSNASYNFRAYTHDEINKILGAKVLRIEEGEYNNEERQRTNQDMCDM